MPVKAEGIPASIQTAYLQNPSQRRYSLLPMTKIVTDFKVLSVFSFFFSDSTAVSLCCGLPQPGQCTVLTEAAREYALLECEKVLRIFRLSVS